MKKFVVSLLSLLSVIAAHAADYYLKNANVTAPQTLANWGVNADGGGAAPDNFTTPGDVFHTQAGQTVTLSTAWTFTATLDVVEGSSFAFGATISSGALTGSGNVSSAINTALGCSISMSSPSVFTYNGGAQPVRAGTYHSLTFSATGTKTAGGDISVNGTITITISTTIFNMATNALSGDLTGSSGAGILLINNVSGAPFPAGRSWSGTVRFNGAANQTIPAGTYNIVQYFTSGRTLTAAGDLTINSSLTLSGSSTLAMESYALAGTLTTINNASGTITTANTSANPLPTGKSWGNGGTVAFTAGGQTVPGGTYPILSLTNASSTQTAGGDLIVSGVLNIMATATLDLSTYTLTGSLGTINNLGIIKTASTSSEPLASGNYWTGTVRFAAATGGQTVPAGTYDNLYLDHTSGTTVAGGDFNVFDNFETAVGGTLSMGLYTLAGFNPNAVNHNGTLTTESTSATPLPSGWPWGNPARTSNVNYTSASPQTVVSGSYANLTIANAGSTLGSEINVSGSLTPALSSFNTSNTTFGWTGTGEYNLGAAALAGLKVLSGTVKLGGATTVSGTTTVTNGVLDLNGHNFSTGALLTSAAQTFGSFGAGIKTGANTLTVVSLPAATTTVVPLITGQANDYSYVQLMPANAVGWTFSLASTITASNPGKALQRTWNLSPVGSPGATNLKFSYNLGATGITSAAAGAWNGTGNVNVNHFNTTLNTWESINGVTSYTPVLTLNNAPNASGTYYDVTVSNVTDFSPFAISQANVVLPVTLTTFTGRRDGNTNKLFWTTASETNNRGFSIERSVDGRTYTSIGFVGTRAIGGNSNNAINYSFADAATPAAKAFYRLTQEDFNGRKKTSTVISLKGDAISGLAISSLYPNPVRSELKLSLESATAGSITLTITDMNGRTVKTETRTISAGANALELNLTSLGSGTYSLRIVSASGTASTSFIKQ